MKSMRNPIFGGLICAAIAALPLAAASADLTPEQQANHLLRDFQTDAQNALDHAAILQFAYPDSQWQGQNNLLIRVTTAVDDMGAKLTRLESIRAEVAPAEQQAIDQIAGSVRALADNTQNAIAFGSSHRQELWNSTYGKYVDGIYADAHNLTHSISDALQQTKMHRDEAGQ